MRLTVVQMLPELQSGGVERGTLEIGRALVAAGHRSVVISGGGRLVRRLQAEGSEHICLPVGAKRWRTVLLIARLRRLLPGLQADILHLRSRLPAWVGYLAWKGLPPGQRPQLVTTVHGLYSVSRYSAIMTCGRAVIATSQTVRDYIERHYPQLPAERIALIHRGVDEREFTARDSAAKAKLAQALRSGLQCPKERRLLLFPGRITRWKGLMTAVEMLRRLAGRVDVQLLVAGEVRRNKRRFLARAQRAAAAAGVDGRISWLGHRDDISGLYSACDLVLHLSEKPEAFGRVAAEALATGTPLVGWDRGGVGEVLRTAFPPGAVACGDMEALIRAVQSVLRAEYGTAQLKTDSFRLQAMQEKTLRLYENLAREKGS